MPEKMYLLEVIYLQEYDQ